MFKIFGETKATDKEDLASGEQKFTSLQKFWLVLMIGAMIGLSIKRLIDSV